MHDNRMLAKKPTPILQMEKVEGEREVVCLRPFIWILGWCDSWTRAFPDLSPEKLSTHILSLGINRVRPLVPYPLALSVTSSCSPVSCSFKPYKEGAPELNLGTSAFKACTLLLEPRSSCEKADCICNAYSLFAKAAHVIPVYNSQMKTEK